MASGAALKPSEVQDQVTHLGARSTVSFIPGDNLAVSASSGGTPGLPGPWGGKPPPECQRGEVGLDREQVPEEDSGRCQ